MRSGSRAVSMAGLAMALLAGVWTAVPARAQETPQASPVPPA
jgi:hypothetical protein